MKGINKRIIAIVLIFVVFLTNLPVAIFASDIEGSDNEPKTNWLGDKATIDVESGTYPYVFMLAQDISNNYYYYETSNHTVQVTGGGAVHLIPMVDTQIVSGEWHPDGIYECGLSNYDVLYCCDAATGTGDGTYYKRANLEDSEYYSELDAKRLRAIVYNSYPYVSVEEAKAFLKEAGFEYADKLDRSELISATQAAIWTIANADSGDTYNYVTTATTGQLRKWGGFFHDFSPEITNFTDSTKASRKPYEEIRTRVDALKAFLLSLDPVDAENKQIVITELDVSRSKISRAENLYAVELKVTLNQGADNNDDVVLRTYVNGVETDVTVRVGRDTEYTLRVNAKANDTIKVTASGAQKLERGVYFYVPEPMDIDGDGIATSREVSQNLIGVAMGETPVYAEKSYVVDVVNVDLEINKVDPNGVALSGAMFALSTADGKHIETKKVNRFGKLVFNDLMPGKYYINEVVAPTGYILIESRIELIVHDDGSITFDGKWSESKPVVGDGIEVKSGDVTVDLVEDGSKTHIKYYYSSVDIVNYPEKTSIAGIKIWNDGNNQDGIRPESIVINLLANGEIVDTVEVTAADEWKYSFTGLAKYENGVEIVYTIEEVAVDGYKTTYEGYNVINTHIPEIFDIEGIKIWNDGNNQDGIRPESIVINLLANGEIVDTVEVTAADEWKYSFTGLAKYENGVEIVYTIEEVAVDGYKTTYEGYNVINTHIPEIFDIEGIKIWNDGNNQDGIRPESIVINLLANGEIVDTVEVTAADEWKYSFTGLAKYENGVEIVYTIEEVAVDGYKTTYEGYNVINTHIPEIFDIEGIKIWNDGNNQDGIRPESIVINLLANGEIVDTVEVTAADEWKYSFTGLAKYENGVEIVYTIEEVAVDGYETTYDGYNVINTHIVRTSITLDGIKYLDADVAEGFTFVLTDVNGNKIATVVSGADGKFTFAELVYTEEGTYVYYISEIIGEDDEIIYDETIYTVTVVVTSDGEKLNASVTLAKDGVSYEGDIEFYNETETILNDDPIPLDPPKYPNPETGDNTSVIALVIAGAIVTLGVVIKSKSRRFE